MKKKRNAHRILDVGCGNGWLTHLLAAQISEVQIFGVDVFKEELEKAAEVFSLPNLCWIYGDVLDNLFVRNCFDIILLNASAQYFPDFSALIDQLFTYLQPDGFILITDTPFYSESEFIKAKERTSVYYNTTQFPAMASHYFHRMFKELLDYNFKILWKPGIAEKILRKLSGNAITPFPIIQITK